MEPAPNNEPTSSDESRSAGSVSTAEEPSSDASAAEVVPNGDEDVIADAAVVEAQPAANDEPIIADNNLLANLLAMDVEDGSAQYPDLDSVQLATHSWEEMRVQHRLGAAAQSALDDIFGLSDEQQQQQQQQQTAESDHPGAEATAVDAEAVQFDTELPSEHSYLGSLDRVTGVAMLEPHRTYRLPVIMHPQIVYPGEQVPMIITQQLYDQISTQRDQQLDDGSVFGMFFPRRQHDRYYGVTCQVYEMGIAERGAVRLKTRAQQRFEITRAHNPQCTNFDNLLADGVLHELCGGLYVTVLPEQQMPDALFGYEHNSWSKFRQSASMERRLRDGWAASMPWPRFVYDQYYVRSVMNKVKCFLSAMDIKTAHLDPVALSFWCAKNVLLRDKHRWEIFQTNSVTKRMMIISQSLDYTRYFVCCQCFAKVAHFNSLFAMSKQGIQTNFCNPAGYIHETNTVLYTVPNAVYLMHGRPSTQFSWFPGYAWQIAACTQCNGHLGWKFSVAPGSKNLVPKRFYGLAGSRIVIRRYVRPHDGDKEAAGDRDEGDSENEHVDTEDSDDNETDIVNEEQFLSALMR